MQLFDDGRRGLCRREQAEPDRELGIDETGLARGRHVGKGAGAGGAVLDKREQLAVPHLLHDETGRPEKEIDPAGNHLGHRLRAALEGHMDHVEAGAHPEALGGKMRRTADTDRGKIQGAGLCFRGRHEIGNRLESARRRNDEDAGRGSERDHGDEIARGIVGEARIERRRDRVGIGIHEQRVAVRFRTRDSGGADGAAGPGAVLHHDGLAKLRPELVEDQPRHDVGGGACAKRHDHFYDLGRPGLRAGRSHCTTQRKENGKQTDHGKVPSNRRRPKLPGQIGAIIRRNRFQGKRRFTRA